MSRVRFRVLLGLIASVAAPAGVSAQPQPREALSDDGDVVDHEVDLRKGVEA